MKIRIESKTNDHKSQLPSNTTLQNKMTVQNTTTAMTSPVCVVPGVSAPCPAGMSYYTRSEILDGLQSKWLLLLGDSSTRGMVLALSTYLDVQHTRPFDFKHWYNVTDPAEAYQANWRGIGGYFFRLDYVFKRTNSGVWVVKYKKVSQITPLDVKRMPESKHVPEVFLDYPNLASDEARISFYNCRNTAEMYEAWTLINGTPDILYANTGAWNWTCNPDTVRNFISWVPQVVWGTFHATQQSSCDDKMSKLPHILTLDNTIIPNMELGKLMNLEKKDWVHCANVVNIMDVMRLFRLLGWPENRRNVEFDRLCAVVGNARDLSRQGIDVVPPDQGWKTPWKLPCRLKIY